MTANVEQVLSKLSPEELALLKAAYQAGIKTPTAILNATKTAQLGILEFGETEFYIPETGQPLVWVPVQRCLMPILAGTHSYPNLLPFYNTVYWSTPKKQAKTSTSGAYSRWRAEAATLNDEILFFANDEAQSRGRAYEAITKSIELNPHYDKVKRVLYDKDGNAVWRIIEDYLEHIPTRTRVKAVNVDYRGEAGANPTLSVWCIDQETELLTDKGWVTYDTFNVDTMKVATRNPVTGAFEWQKPKAVNIKPFSGSMYAVHGKQIDMSVTPNHRLWAKTASTYSEKHAGPLHFLHVEEAASRSATFIPDSFSSWTPSNTEELEPELEIDAKLYARFMGWYLSEGCTHKDEAVLISQSNMYNPDKLDEIVALVEEMGYKPGIWNAENTHTCVAIYDKSLVAYCKRFGTQDKRYVPQWLKESKYLSEFLACYIKGDGHLETLANRIKIGTISKRMCDDLQEIGLKLGYWVSSGEYVDARSPKQIQYTIRLYDGHEGQHCWTVRKPMWQREDYQGIVWCPSTENGIITVRRNGKVYQTGNTEVWGYDSDKQEKLFDEMTDVLTRERSQRYLEGYAGYVGRSKIQKKVEDLLVEPDRGGRQLSLADIPDWPGVEREQLGDKAPDQIQLPCYVNDAAGVFGFIDRNEIARTRWPWCQGPEAEAYYHRQAITLTPEQYDRLHLNHWVSPVTAFLPIEWHAACADPTVPILTPWRRPVSITEPPRLGERDSEGRDLLALYMAPSNWEIVGPPQAVVLSVDASVAGDCTALSAFTRHPTRHQDVVHRRAYKWDPPKGGKLDYNYTPNARTGYSLVQQTVKLCMEYNVVQLSYDEWQLHHMMNELRQRELTWCKPFSQATARDVADKQLYDLIKEKRYSYNPDEPELDLISIRAHIQNAARKQRAGEDTKLHIIKASDEGKIDLVITMSMGTAETLRLDL
jgi:hypothetical protein